MEIIKIIILIILFICILFNITKGYQEKFQKYTDKYERTLGTIVDKKIEIINTTEANNNEIPTFSNISKYKLKVFFEYKVDGKYYTSNFINEKYLEYDEIQKIWKKYYIDKIIDVYYNKNNYNECYYNLRILRDKNKNTYYLFAVVLFILFSVILFSSYFNFF